MRILISLVILLFSVPVLAETVDKIVAKVGEDVITLSDVAQAVAEQRTFLYQKYGQKKGFAEFEKFKKNALNELILQKIMKSEIEKEGIQIDDSLVDQEYKTNLKRMNTSEIVLLQKLKKQGLTIMDYKKNIKREIAKQQFIQKKIMPTIAISDYDLQQEYEKNKNNYLTYNKYRFIEVYLEPSKFNDTNEMYRMAQTIQGKLKSGQSVSALIKKYSAGAFAASGGDSGLVEGTKLRQEIQSFLARLKRNEVSQIIPIQNGMFVFKLLAKSDPTPMAYNKVANQIRVQYGERLVSDGLKKYLYSVKDQMYVEILR